MAIRSRLQRRRLTSPSWPLLASALIPDTIFGPDNANTYPLTLGLPITVVWFALGVVVCAKRPQELDVMANEMATADLVGEDDNPRRRATAAALSSSPPNPRPPRWPRARGRSGRRGAA